MTEPDQDHRLWTLERSVSVSGPKQTKETERWVTSL